MSLAGLQGKKGLVVGVANADSLAWAVARAAHEAGAELALTYLNDKARPFVAPLAERIGAPLLLPCDVRTPGALESVFEAIGARWGRLDFAIHAIAFARRDDLHGRLVDSSAEGFAEAMVVSCHSLVRMAKLAEPLMAEGGSLLTLSYFGAEKVVEHYNVMGPVKAALEATVRYLAHELGPRRIRVNALSPGPIRTRAASGIEHFDELVAEAERRSAERRSVTAEEVGRMALALLSDLGSGVTGEVVHVDAGFHIAGMVFHRPPTAAAGAT
jgi:enoyl-[acyl-carrier protein] reductase I